MLHMQSQPRFGLKSSSNDSNLLSFHRLSDVHPSTPQQVVAPGAGGLGHHTRGARGLSDRGSRPRGDATLANVCLWLFSGLCDHSGKRTSGKSSGSSLFGALPST